MCSNTVEELRTASWPSPAQDYLAATVSIDREVLSDSTFVMRVVGDDLSAFGISGGDRLVIDRGLDAALGQLVVVETDGIRQTGLYRQLRGKRVLTIGKVDLPLADGARAWGVVTHCVHQLDSVRRL